MLQMWKSLRESDNGWLKTAAALTAFCVIAALVMAINALASAGHLQTRIDRGYALESAQQRLAAGLVRQQAGRFEDTLNALLQQPEFAFRYLAVRDADGTVLAANGRYESLNSRRSFSPDLNRWLRAKLYTAFAESGRLTLRDGERTVGSLEYAIGSPSGRLARDEAIDRLRMTGWVVGTLALLFGAATVLLLRAALNSVPKTPGLAEQLGTAASLQRLPTMVPQGSSTDPLPAAFDTLKIGVLDIDGELRVRLINDTAAALTGWNRADALGQLVYTVFHARDDAGAPIPSPAERCVRQSAEQPPQDLRLRPRGGSSHDAMVEARASLLIGINGGARMLFQDAAIRIASHDRLRSQVRVAEGVVDHLLEAVLTTDMAGVVKSANARALRMFGYSSEEMQRMTVARLLPVPFMNTPGLKLTDYMPGGQSRTPKLAGWRKDATTFPAELVVELMRTDGEDRLVVIIRDISEQMRSQSLAQRLGRLLDSASEEVYIFDAQSLYFTEVNKGACKNLGLKAEQLNRMSLANIANDLDPVMLQSYVSRLRGGEVEHITYKATHKRSNDSTYPVEVRVSFSRDEEPPVFMAIALDITEREAAEKRMRQLAHYDALTNLPNRPLLFDRLKQAMQVSSRGGRQLAVLFMDLDGFKPINDAHGHEAGDSVLQAVADRLNTGLRAADTVARFGGDEFVVLALGIRDADEAINLAGKVHELFKQPFDICGQKMTLCMSIGISLYPSDPADAEGLLRHADAAMYEAKQKGQGRTELFALAHAGNSAAKPKPQLQRADLAREIHLGLTSKQFQLQLLPVHRASGELAASVVDFYWTHPEFGRVDSRDTLHAARRADLNAEIEYWMLCEAAEQHRLAQKQGLPPLPLLLPLTGRQWRDPEFPERLLRVMDAAATPLKLLLPVIDGSDWPDAAAPVQVLWQQLLQQGLRIAVRQPDPAGPLNDIALALLPLHGENAADETKILALAHRYQSLQKPVLIEGLRSAAQWERLRIAGAHYGAGLQLPLTPLEFVVWAGSREIKPL